MSRISLLAFASLLCFVVVQTEDSQEHQTSISSNDLSNLNRNVRSPEGNPKKKNKKKKQRKNKNGQQGRRKKGKNIIKGPTKKSGSRQTYTPRSKSNSRKPNFDWKTKNNPQKVKLIQKKNKKRKIQSNKYRRQTSADDTNCLANIELAMDFDGKQIKNFKNQKKRAEDFDDLMKRKGDKKNIFQNSTTYLKETLGTDNSCKIGTNKTVFDEAIKQLSILSNCSTSVELACARTYNATELSSCETKFKTVTTKTKECYKLTTPSDDSAACPCWKEAAKLVAETKTLKCSAKNSSITTKMFTDICLSKFSDCKKAEDASVRLIQLCNGRNIPSLQCPAPTQSSSPPSSPPPSLSSPSLSPPSPASPSSSLPSASSPSPTSQSPSQTTTPTAAGDF